MFKLNFFSHFWLSNEFLVFIKSNSLMSRSFWVYLQPSRCFLWEVVVVWSSDARNSWKFPILQISQNMTKLAILATLTNFILPTSFFELYHSNFWGSITTIISEIRETLEEVLVSTTFVQSRLVSVSKTTEIPSLDESRSRHHRISQSRWVSVSTATEFPSLDESRSQQPQKFPVSMSLGLDNHRI